MQTKLHPIVTVRTAGKDTWHRAVRNDLTFEATTLCGRSTKGMVKETMIATSCRKCFNAELDLKAAELRVAEGR